MNDEWENEGGAVQPVKEHVCPYEKDCCKVCAIADSDRAKARTNGCCVHGWHTPPGTVPNG